MKILEICVELDGGGIDRYLYNYCIRIDDIHFDYVVVDNGKKRGFLEEELKSRGSKIYRVTPLRSGIKKNYLQLKEIMANGAYDAVHVHLGYKSFNALKCAKDCGINTRIVHAHIADEPENIFKKIIRKFCTWKTKKYATNLAACGEKAAKWVWGSKTFKKGLVKIHSNAIQTEQFEFNASDREKYRQQLKIESKIVFGNIGRIGVQKNQIRLVRIFNEIYKINNNCVLLLIGNDETNGECKRIADDLGLSNCILFLGVRNDINHIINAFDCYLFPSLYEGLPFTLVEAECNGVPILYSDIVTDEVQINANVERFSLKNDDCKWAEASLRLAGIGRDNHGIENVRKRGFDVKVETLKLKDYYFKAIKENNND